MRRGRETAIAIVDVAAGAAGVAIVGVSRKGPARAFASAQSRIALDEKTDAQHRASIARHISDAAQEAMKRYAAGGHRMPITEAYAFLHAPWSQSTTRSLASKRAEMPARVTDAMIGGMAKECLAALSESDRAGLYEASIIRVMLNGYPTADPAGKYANDIEITSLFSAAEKEIRATVQSAIESAFPAATIAWRSFARAIITLFRESKTFGQYVAIDMRADSTDVLSFRFGILDERVASEGVASILSRLSGGSPDETITSLRMLARDACSTDACEKIEKAIALAEPDLVRVFGEAMGQLASPRRLSNELFLVAHPDLEPWLSRFFARIDFSQFTMTTLPFTVHTPASIDMSPFVAGELPDIALQVCASLVNIEHAE